MYLFCCHFLAKPEAPTNLQVYNVTWESATLRWTPGFNGGFPQSFVVVYTSAYQTPTQINVHNSPEDSTFRIGGKSLSNASIDKHILIYRN